MEFAILFIIAFLIGAAIYSVNSKWVWAVAAPMSLFAINIIADNSAQQAWGFTLTFGLPLVFFGSLLGCYVIQIRRFEEPELSEELGPLFEPESTASVEPTAGKEPSPEVETSADRK